MVADGGADDPELTLQKKNQAELLRHALSKTVAGARTR